MPFWLVNSSTLLLIFLQRSITIPAPITARTNRPLTISGKAQVFLPKSLSAPPPPLKKLPASLRSESFLLLLWLLSSFFFFFWIFFLSLWVCSWIPNLGVNCLSAQHVWYLRVSPVRLYFENYTPPKIQIIDYVSNSHPEVQKFKPTALRMAKA